MRSLSTSRTTTRVVLPLVGLALALSACGGDADEATPEAVVAEADGPSVSAPLPPAGDDEEGLVTQGACVEDEPDCEDTLVQGDAGATCLVGAEDCADDPSGGVDQARVLPLADELPGGEPLQPGEADGATGAVVVAATATDTGVAVAVEGGPCDVVQDVLVLESDTEVRLLVLTGTPPDTTCATELVTRTVEVELAAPLGDRTLLDLAG